MHSKIPKIIHYCWFGGNPLPDSAKKCIDSWKKYLPDHEIKEWNENNFDIKMVTYTAEAYQAKKYAFVSDYARFWILHKHGGIYFDTDVEIIRPMDDILEVGAYMGCEKDSPIRVNPGVGMATPSKLPLCKELIKNYNADSFTKDGKADLTTIVERTTKVLKNHGLTQSKKIQKIAGITIYPAEYFSPIDYDTMVKQITTNTKSIHHFDASWVKGAEVIALVKRMLGPKGVGIARNILRRHK